MSSRHGEVAFRGRRIALLGLAAVAAAAVVPGAAARPDARADAFFGSCDLQGQSTTLSAGRFMATFEGHCAGVLNGAAVAAAPLRVVVRGSSASASGLPLRATGAGLATIRDPRTLRYANIGFTLRQVGPVGNLTGDGGGDAVVVAPGGSATPLVGSMHTAAPLRG